MKKYTRYKNKDLSKHVYSAESEIHGTGLFANRDIKNGEYIGTYWGPETKRNGMHVLWVYDPEDETDIVGRNGKNLLRYLNHHHAPNIEFDSFDAYATCDISEHDELTIDYGEEFSAD